MDIRLIGNHAQKDGTIIFDIQTSQIKQRCSFTEI